MRERRITPQNFRAHARDLSLGNYRNGKDIHSILLPFVGKDRKQAHYKPELYAITAVIGNQVLSEVEWPKKLDFFPRMKYDNRTAYYRSFKSEVLDHIRPVTTRILAQQSDSPHVVRIQEILSRLNDWRGSVDKYFFSGFGTAMQTLGAFMELAPRLYKEKNGRKPNVKTAISLFANSNRVVNKIANNHLENFGYIRRGLFTHVPRNFVFDSFLYEELQSEYFSLEGNQMVFSQEGEELINRLGSSSHDTPELGCPALIKMDRKSPTLISRLKNQVLMYAEEAYSRDYFVD